MCRSRRILEGKYEGKRNKGKRCTDNGETWKEERRLEILGAKEDEMEWQVKRGGGRKREREKAATKKQWERSIISREEESKREI